MLKWLRRLRREFVKADYSEVTNLMSINILENIVLVMWYCLGFFQEKNSSVIGPLCKNTVMRQCRGVIGSNLLPKQFTKGNYGAKGISWKDFVDIWNRIDMTDHEWLGTDVNLIILGYLGKLIEKSGDLSDDSYTFCGKKSVGLQLISRSRPLGIRRRQNESISEDDSKRQEKVGRKKRDESVFGKRLPGLITPNPLFPFMTQSHTQTGIVNNKTEYLQI